MNEEKLEEEHRQNRLDANALTLSVPCEKLSCHRQLVLRRLALRVRGLRHEVEQRYHDSLWHLRLPASILLDTPRRALIPRLVMRSDEASEGSCGSTTDCVGVTNGGPMCM